MISSLVEAAIRSIGVALIVGIGLRIFRVRNVLAQKAAWSLVLAAALVMPIAQSLPKSWRGLPLSMTLHLPTLHLPTVHLPVEVWRQGQAVPAVSQAVPLQARAAAEQFQVEPAVAGGNHFPEAAVSDSRLDGSAQVAEMGVVVEASPEVSKLAVLWGMLRRVKPLAFAWILYSAVSLALLLRLCFGMLLAARIWLGAEPALLDASLGLDFRFAVRSSAAVSSPVTVGSGVLLPSDFRQWEVEKLRIVLAHEESHIRHADFYLQVVAGLYGALFWFSPLGWWLKRKLSELGEAISDLAGLEEAASRTSYARLLVEFAAQPRPTLIGVAMARSSNLSLRIDRLLDESIFRQAFAGKRRLLVAVFLVPVALFAATAMLRVEAAGQATPPAPPVVPVAAPAPNSAPAPAAPQEPLTGVSSPDAAPAEAPAAAPLAPPVPDLAPAAPDVAPPAPPAPYPHAYGEIHDSADGKADGNAYSQSSSSSDSVSTSSQTDVNGKRVPWTSVRHYSYSRNGDSWAVVTGPNKLRFSGDWIDGTRESIDKARKLASGEFLWFTRGGKSYLIEDAALVAQVLAMYKPMDELGRQQEELGRQQEKLGQEQAALANEQSQVRVQTPDMSREIADVDAALAKLKAERNTKVSQEELGEIQSRLAELQGKLGEIQGRAGDRMGEYGEKQGHLGELQGKLGEQQGRLGEQQGKIAEEADRKVKSIIDQSLGNGKARPVQ